MPGLPQHLTALLQPSAYPHSVQTVALIETHISWVLLTGEFAYKIKRPVQYPFIDQRSAERRTFLCREEVRLNRRFAPEIYLEVCAITSLNGEVRIGGAGQTFEHAVKMRQFRREDELDRLLSAGRIEPSELEVFGRDLALIHAGLPIAGETNAWGRPTAVRALIAKNLEECAHAARVLDREADVQALREPLEVRLESAARWMQERVAGGRVRECHGDLHTHNIIRQDSRLIAFDCLEFEPAFRWIDVADEVAFLLADLESQPYSLHAQAFLSGYLAQSGDYSACRLLDLYQVHRALVRAKIIGLRAAEATDVMATDRARREHNAYLECARRGLQRRRPKLILMAGLSGSGKTWLAKHLAPILRAVHLRSDVQRKRLAGLSELARSGSEIEQGLYSWEASVGVYRHLLHCARHVLEGGYTAIVDATFQRREDRARFHELSLQLGIPLCVVRCHAPREVLELRIRGRYQGRKDASEADLCVLHWQEAHFEPIEADEQIPMVEAMTADVDVIAESTRQIGVLTHAS